MVEEINLCYNISDQDDLISCRNQRLAMALHLGRAVNGMYNDTVCKYS